MEATALASLFLQAYRQGVFPMADSAHDTQIMWIDPPLRGQLDILNLHIPSRLKRTVLKFPYRVTVDQAFADVVDLCAESAVNRPSTWISHPIRDAFVELHQQGYAHSVDVWQNNKLVGGLYGLALGGVFCGESMASRAVDVSKIALVHLCARLHWAGFQVLDTQFVNDHLQQFGVYEIPRADYHVKLQRALMLKPDFRCDGADEQTIIETYFTARLAQTVGS
jgi:leucyl/phenylalanyl-tRNA---protein transferase